MRKILILFTFYPPTNGNNNGEHRIWAVYFDYDFRDQI